jgi:hypothetical protein
MYAIRGVGPSPARLNLRVVAVPWRAEAPGSANPTHNCVAFSVSMVYIIGPTCLMEIPVQIGTRKNKKKGERMKKACFAPALFLALALNARATTGTGTVPISGTIINSCLSEPVAFSGTGTFVFTTQHNSDGTFTGSFNFHFQAQGVGLDSGRSYSVVITEGNTLTLRAFAGIASEFIETFAVSGSGGHLLLHFIGHITINNDGTVTVEFGNWTTQC